MIVEPGQSPDERFCVVDEDDRVVGYRTRAECHADPSLIHRSVYVIVDTPQGRLFQRRGFGKDSAPGGWDASCAGHVDGDEGYAAAARRELMEELGIDAEPEFVGTLLLRVPTETEMTGVFRLAHPGPFLVRPPEVIGVCAFRPGEEPSPLPPGTRIVLDWLAERTADG